MMHASRFTSPAVIGSVAAGVSEETTASGRSYSTEWSGVYEGVRPSEWTGEPVHSFRAGAIGETPQQRFAIPVSQFEEAGTRGLAPAEVREQDHRDHPHDEPCPRCGRRQWAEGDPPEACSACGHVVKDGDFA